MNLVSCFKIVCYVDYFLDKQTTTKYDFQNNSTIFNVIGTNK